MKNNLFVMALVCLVTFSFGAKATNLKTDEFQITPIDKPSVELATKEWTLKYKSNNDFELTIDLMPTKKGYEYVVYSKYFEVSYACCKDGFGAKDVKPAWSKVDSKYKDLVLDPAKLATQKIITSNEVSESEALGLIASYLPDLLKNEYKYLLNN
ncbi:MAG: hypothetical protein A2W90_21290 [Bacteroidetes bacterium GWF2_42_66]|jgi:hypothetical protein|nr:MAG: hypothetical protein A2W92_02410 [Bacteroidetes bacterium GWA2_42_15]OFX98870.1 MAG: hypothetical protein A2W89_12930 [Bacteroidetes bacterium GWE2_42_39]OFY45584.1 MAG: hypothetical protein A2W90_21290 [Bacteroidetes bacterium GWF2_42_66]HBL77436.1 hypothetical protein [Prolixibacteraceae bacterium]HCU62400.1 hypothetical protein [Prolixibacteraceae bacterium]